MSFLKIFGGHMSFYGATNTSALDVWWCLRWVSKPEWVALFTLGRGEHDVHSPKFTSGATPAKHLMVNINAIWCSQHACFNRFTLFYTVAARNRTKDMTIGWNPFHLQVYLHNNIHAVPRRQHPATSRRYLLLRTVPPCSRSVQC